MPMKKQGHTDICINYYAMYSWFTNFHKSTPRIEVLKVGLTSFAAFHYDTFHFVVFQHGDMLY